MLIEFNVENFRSISDRVSLSFVPSRSKQNAYSIIDVQNNPNITRILKSLVLFGSNGSGKTNVIRALNAMRNMVIKSKNFNRGDRCKYYDPFILDDEYSQKPTKFEIFFIKDNIEYRYEFAFDLNTIVFENLSYFSKKKDEIFIFKRTANHLETFTDREYLYSLFHSTGDNVLFLSKANNEYREFWPVFEWFNNQLRTIGPTTRLSSKYTIDYMNKSPGNSKKIINFMRFADFDIHNITGEQKIASLKELLDGGSSFTVTFTKSDKNPDNDDNSEVMISDIKSIRKKIDGTEIIQNFKEFESSGTQKFFDIAGLWFETLEEKDRILVIDEFDIRLHPDLQEFLIKIFHDPDYNKINSQLIFTTHNTRLLASNFFRRDQINFVEKNKATKSTEISSLYDYEKRQDKSIEKEYYLGRYGGLPDIKYSMF